MCLKYMYNVLEFAFDRVENIVETSIFSFSYNVFKRFLCHLCQLLGLFGKGLTLNHSILTFNNPKEEGFGKNLVGKGENAGNQTEVVILATFNLSSPIRLNLLTSKILLFG